MILRLSPYLLGLLLTVGCEIDNTSSDSAPNNNQQQADLQSSEQTTPEPSDALPADLSADQVEWNNIVWYTSSGPAARTAVPVMNLTASIDSNGQFIRFSWDRMPWGDGAMGCFFVWNGSAWEGGKFEWIRPGGQAVKETKNIRNGYNGLRAPAPGTPVAFAWTSRDLKQRSNLAKTTWR